jgi:opacity protein-like surface antigen
MKKILLVTAVIMLTAASAYAADDNKTATEPLGAIVEASGVFIGTVSEVAVDTITVGQAKGRVTVADEAGQTKIFPVDDTVKIMDAMVNVITLNQLKKGQKVEVQYTKAPNGAEKVSSVKVMQ